MKLVKIATRNSNRDQFMSDWLVCYIEKELIGYVTNETVIKKKIQSMSDRRVHL